jgi:hypothetical protein
MREEEARPRARGNRLRGFRGVGAGSDIPNEAEKTDRFPETLSFSGEIL